MITVRAIGWNQIGNVAVDKEFTSIRTKDSGYMNAAITTGNDHCTRVLAILGKMFVPRFVFSKFCSLPALKTLNQIFW